MSKPYPDYPLFLHRSGQWCRKVRGKFHYFGKGDPYEALERYQKVKDDLYAGREPEPDKLRIEGLKDYFLQEKRGGRRKLAPVTLEEYEVVCDLIAGHFKGWAVDSIQRHDLTKLLAILTTGKQGQTLSLATQKRRITIARMLFSFAEDYKIQVPYKRTLVPPRASELEKQRKKNGPRMYEAADIHKLVSAAEPQMKAIILLGINAAFGAKDCEKLPASAIDGEYCRFPRPKTGKERLAWLWPETREALKDYNFEAGWDRFKVADEFAKLCEESGVMNHGHYSLRRTFETKARNRGIVQFYIDGVMGHARHTMADKYTEEIEEPNVKLCCEAVRDWFLAGAAQETDQAQVA